MSRLQGQAVEGVIGRAHDPETLPPSPDRVPRGEVYEKVWAPRRQESWTSGMAGTGWTSKPLSKPGESVMELKAVRLSRSAIDLFFIAVTEENREQKHLPRITRFSQSQF